jgi:hypothetical protein
VQKIINFLNAGKAVYLESAIIGTGDHALLRPYFGLGENSIPNNLYSEIETLIADSTETFTGYSLNYLYGSNADYGIDILDFNEGTPLMHSQDDAVRSGYYDSGSYRTIASSTFFGAMADGSNENTKAQVMGQYLNFLIGDPIPNIIVSHDELDFGITFPDYPYSLELEISNFGLDTLNVTDVVISGEGFNYFGSTEFTVIPSEQQVLEISFETYEIGQYLGELAITSNDPDTPELVVQLSAECVLPPIIQCNPLSVEITITSNQIHEGIMILSNIGAYDLNCELVVTDSSQYAGWLEIDQDSLFIQPNGYEEILLTFDPDGLENGQYSAEIVIYHNDPTQDELIIPVIMTLNYTNVYDELLSANNKLIGNYPNPFNPSTTISFTLNTDNIDDAKIEIYNLKGQKVKTLSVILSGVEGSATWDGTDNNNQPASSGIYFYKLKSGDC